VKACSSLILYDFDVSRVAVQLEKKLIKDSKLEKEMKLVCCGKRVSLELKAHWFL